MALPVLEIELASLSEIGVSVDSFFVPVADDEDTGNLTTVAVGRCYALGYSQLSDEARRLGTAWHRLLLEVAVSSLWDEETTRPALLAYVPGNIIRLFVFTKQRRFLTKVYDRLRELCRNFGPTSRGASGSPLISGTSS